MLEVGGVGALDFKKEKTLIRAPIPIEAQAMM